MNYHSGIGFHGINYFPEIVEISLKKYRLFVIHRKKKLLIFPFKHILCSNKN